MDTKKMKQTLIILSLMAVLGCCKSQTGVLGKRVYETVGNIFSVQFNASSGSLFTRTGSSGTWTYGSGGLSLSGTGTNTADNFIEYSGWYTDLEKSTAEITFTPTSDGNGIGVGFITSFGAPRYYYGLIVLTGANKGQLRFEQYVSGSITNRANSGTTLFNVTNGQEHKLSLRRTPDSMFVTITNTVTNASQSLGYAAQFTSNATVNHYKAGRMAVIWYGGSQTVTNFRYYSPIVKNPRLLFTGDSNMQGCYVGSNSNRYVIKLDSATVARIEVTCGSGNTGADIVNLLPEILLINPRALFVNIGTNGVTQANIDTIRNTCSRNNIPVFLSTIFPLSSGVNSNNSIIRGESGVTLIDFDATLLNGGSGLYSGYDSGDGTHLNAAGDSAVFTQLLSDLGTYLSSD